MGAACCGRSNIYPEIDEATTLKELSDFLINRREFAQKQIVEIKDYLGDKGKIPKSLEVATITEINLKKRIDYLEEYQASLPRAITSLDSNPKMELNASKNLVHKLWDCFFEEFDDYRAYLKVIDDIKYLSDKK